MRIIDTFSVLSAGRNGSVLKRKGISVPLSDVIIAADCIDHGLILIESDRHFATIAARLSLKRHAGGDRGRQRWRAP